VRLLDIRRTPARDLVLSTTVVPTMMLRVFRMHLRGRPHKLWHCRAAFIKRLAAENSKEAAKHITAAVETFVDSHTTAGSDGQVRRAAQRLGLIGTAGEMAAGWGIVPWAPGEAFAAAEAALASWVEGRGGTEGAEVREAISRVRLFIETHGDSRFEPVDKSDDFRSVTNRAGWRKGSGAERVWLVPAETWKTEICSGLDADSPLACWRIAGCWCGAMMAFCGSTGSRGGRSGHTRSLPRSWEGTPDVSGLGCPPGAARSGDFTL